MTKLWVKVGESIAIGGHDVTVAAIEAGSAHLSVTNNPYRIILRVGDKLRLEYPNHDQVIIQLIGRRTNQSVRLGFETPPSICPTKRPKSVKE